MLSNDINKLMNSLLLDLNEHRHQLGQSCLQDPVIFSGTVRHNLDPVGRVAADADLWAAIRSAGLLETLQSLQVRWF